MTILAMSILRASHAIITTVRDGTIVVIDLTIVVIDLTIVVIGLTIVVIDLTIVVIDDKTDRPSPLKETRWYARG
jgi:hypothetical protein